jgi:hypothetical protein
MTRPTTEGCMSIDIRSWHREGRLRAGQCFLHTLTWNWRPTEGIAVLAKTDAVYLMFRSRNWPSECGPTITQRIPIAWTPCTLGGSRPWFRCEAYSNGRYCGRRVALLYSAGRVFVCRHCRGLAYDCQNETPYLRAIRRVRKIRMRLGAGFSFAEPFPDKPRGMHRRTYLRMRLAAGESIALYDHDAGAWTRLERKLPSLPHHRSRCHRR